MPKALSQVTILGVRQRWFGVRGVQRRPGGVRRFVASIGSVGLGYGLAWLIQPGAPLESLSILGPMAFVWVVFGVYGVVTAFWMLKRDTPEESNDG